MTEKKVMALTVLVKRKNVLNGNVNQPTPDGIDTGRNFFLRMCFPAITLVFTGNTLFHNKALSHVTFYLPIHHSRMNSWHSSGKV